ncbi:hypothetical protein ACFE04_003397 [Oxalis oulophora]
MGRGRLSMEMIREEKPRMITYQKRKKGLLKKAEELSILCDIKTCVIIHGPKCGDQNLRELVTFPQDRDEFTKIVNKFISKPISFSSDASRRKNANNLLDFFITRQKKVNDEILKLRRENREAKFPSWDDSFNGFSVEHLEAAEKKVALKLEAAKMKQAMRGKSKSFTMQNYWAKPESSLTYNNSNNVVEHTTQVPRANFMPFNNYGYNNQMLPVNQNQTFPAYFYHPNNQDALQMFLYPGVNSVQGINYNELQRYQLYGADHQWMKRASKNLQIPESKFPAACHDTKPEMLENIVYNPVPRNFCGVPNSQPLISNDFAEQKRMGIDNSYTSLLNVPMNLNVPEFHEYFNDTMPRS